MKVFILIMLLVVVSGCKPKPDDYVFKSEEYKREAITGECVEKYGICLNADEIVSFISYAANGNTFTGKSIGQIKERIAGMQSVQAAKNAVELSVFRQEYSNLGAPKILYVCDGKTGFSAGVGMNATYNHIVMEAKRGCGDFRIVESQQ